jgi:queuine tRNA-ribosyltransferase
VVRAGEIIASMLLSWHNLAYYQDLMVDMRAAIAAGTAADYARKVFAAYPRPAAGSTDTD